MKKLTMQIKRYIHDKTGVAAIEFGLIFPLLVSILFGGYAVFEFLNVQRDTERASAVVSDLVSRQASMSAESADDFIEIAEALMGDVANDPTFSVMLASVSNTFDTGNDETLTLDWSFASKDSERLLQSQISSLNLPEIPEGETIVLAEVKLDYSSLVITNYFGVKEFDQLSVRRPRFVTMVELDD